MPFVFSTASADAYYTKFSTAKKDGSPGVILKKVLIKGGATIAPVQRGLITPQGIMTQVSDEDMEFLLSNPAFKRHMDAGHISVQKAKADPDKVAQKMTPNDNSSPKLVTAKATSETAKEIVKKVASKGK